MKKGQVIQESYLRFYDEIEKDLMETLTEWEMSGQVQLFMTSSVGERRMPESSAVLILRF